MRSFIIYVGVFITSAFFLELFLNRSVFVAGQYNKGKSELQRLFCVLLAMLPILYILGNRYNVGTDYKNYLTMYHDYTAWGYKNVEIGITLLFDLANLIGIGYQGFLWICAVLTVFVSVYVLCRLFEYKYSGLAALLYLLMYFGPACNILAQIISLSFIIIAYKEIEERRLIRFLICCMMALLFHSGSIIIIPIYWLYNLLGKGRNWFIISAGIAISIFFVLFPGTIASLLTSIGLERYAAYIAHEKIYTFLYYLIYRLPLYLAELINYKRLIKRSDKNDLYYFLLGFEMIGIILGIGISWFGRITYFFSIAHIILDIRIIDSNAQSDKTIYRMLFISYYILVFYFMHFISNFDGISVFQLISI